MTVANVIDMLTGLRWGLAESAFDVSPVSSGRFNVLAFYRNLTSVKMFSYLICFRISFISCLKVICTYKPAINFISV